MRTHFRVLEWDKPLLASEEDILSAVYYRTHRPQESCDTLNPTSSRSDAG